MSDDVAENDTVTASDAVTGVVDDRSEPERQRDEYLDALQRLQADFENYRKRVARSCLLYTSRLYKRQLYNGCSEF